MNKLPWDGHELADVEELAGRLGQFNHATEILEQLILLPFMEHVLTVAQRPRIIDDLQLGPCMYC